ncbi:hypothetical protein HYU18_04825 [Candidatus Woesearchaeota archaeon]|nr:hypothetical protein [Candidatus Woesearchaeota archaeon]
MQEPIQDSNLETMKEKLLDLKRQLMTFEWDKSHSQLNSGMEARYIQVKAEFESLNKKVEDLKAAAQL